MAESSTTHKLDKNNAKTVDNELSEKELLEKVEECMNAKDYESAADFGSSALELLQKKHIALEIDSAQYYVVYGEALLRLIQSQNDIFGAPVREKQQEYQALKEQATNENDTEKTNDKEEADADDEDVCIEQEQKNEIKNVNEEPVSDENKEPEPNDEDHDTTEDRQIAWESFEAARVIIENHQTTNKDIDTNYILILSQIHSFLGELALEEERHKFALSEFEKSLKLQNECIENEIEIHPRKKSFNRFMACLAAQFSELYDDALKHCKTCLNELNQQMWEIMCKINETKCDKTESVTNSELIKSAKTLIATQKEKMSEEELNKCENISTLKELIEISIDLDLKYAEVQETIEMKKEQEEKEKEKEVGYDMNALTDNPGMLNNLIAGFTTAFGIKQSDIDQMESDLKNEENNANNKNQKNTNKKEGITTIGFGNNENQNNLNGVTTIGFGNNNNSNKDDPNEVINEITVVRKKQKKRNAEEANLEQKSTEIKKRKIET